MTMQKCRQHYYYYYRCLPLGRLFLLRVRSVLELLLLLLLRSWQASRKLLPVLLPGCCS